MSRHPAAYVVAENDMTAYDCEPNPLLATERCSVCEHGHGGHVCRWCIAEGRTA